MPAQSNFVCLAPFFDDAFIRETRELLTAHAVLTGPGVVRFTDVTPEESVRDAAKAKAAEAHCDSVFTPGELMLASFKAFFFDMDSTLVTTETLDEMAEICGTGEECARITAGTMQGTIKNYAESLRARVALLKDHDAQALETVRAHTKINPGVPELLKALHAHGVKTYVLSSGFTAMTKPLAESLGMTGYHSNVIGIENGLFTGETRLCGKNDEGTGGDAARSCLLRGRQQRHSDGFGRGPGCGVPAQEGAPPLLRHYA